MATTEASFGPTAQGKRAEHPDGDCLCAACKPERKENWRRHTGENCPWCGGGIRTVLDGERWCDTCQRYL